MSVHLLFSGQGAQRLGMGKSLFKKSPRARQRYEEADATLGFPLSQISFEGPESTLTETRFCQPALYLQGFCLAEWLLDQGKLSRESIASAFGLSLGELTALAIAGVFDFTTGLQVVAERGRLMQEACEATDGSMAALIGGSRESAAELALRFVLDVANFNCPGQIVISGSQAGIQSAVEAAPAAGFKMAKELNVAGAYHSRLMHSAAEKFASFLQDIDFRPPEIPVYTNTTGERITEPEAIREALVKQITGSVYFEDNLKNAVQATQVTRFLECGPGGVLAGFIRRIDRNWEVIGVSEFEDLLSVDL